VWTAVKTTWKNADSFLTAVQSRGYAAAAADYIGLNKTSGKRVDDLTFALRRRSCFGDGLTPGCEMMIQTQNGRFCSACACKENKLARLDEAVEGGYTKLHYPELQCPLAREGFSNHKRSELSVVIPTLNEDGELWATVESVRKTAPHDVEIIVIDDGSTTPVKLPDPSVRVIRNSIRAGCSGSRHIGLMRSTRKYTLFLDAHMRCVPGWYEKAIERLEKSPHTIWCGLCWMLDEKNTDLKKATAACHGGKLALIDSPDPFTTSWADNKTDADDYELSCLLGACYFAPRQWLLHLRGFHNMTYWGSDEQALSIKSWLAGGDVRLAKSVQFGHRFRKSFPYPMTYEDVYYDRLRALKTLTDEKTYELVSARFPNNPALTVALKRLELHKSVIERERDYYRKIFVRSFDWLCDKFNIKQPMPV